jgi:4-hydroxy-2-oxoglutarate aldolase
MWQSNLLAGIFPPVPTPFDQHGEIAPDKLVANLERLAKTALKGFIILGSNGEYVYLDEGEKLALFQAARRAIPKDKLFIAGTGAESTRAALRLTLAAAVAGADAAIVITPSYYKPAMTAEALITHFTTLAEVSPIPIIIYNMPGFTGLDISTEIVVKLAAHPNIIGLKESSGNVVKMGEIAWAVEEKGLDFAVLAGSASFLQAGMAVGAKGSIVATANIAPQLCLELYAAADEVAKARALQYQLLALNAAVTTRYGVAGLKYAMDRIKLYGGPVRPPLLPIATQGCAEIDQLLNQVRLL